jgi:Domain of unknown function (DUF1906)
MSARQLPWLARSRRSLAVIAVAVLGAQAVAAGASAGASAAAGHGPFKQVSYRGYTFDVLRNWQVVRLAWRPHYCVRFDQDTLYLGWPPSNENCPSSLFGTTEAVLVEPGPGSSAAWSAEDPVSRRITVSAPRIRIIATFDKHPGQIYRFLTRASLPDPRIVHPNPAAATLSSSGTRLISPDLLTGDVLAPQPSPLRPVPPTTVLTAASDALPGQVTNYRGLGFDTCTAPSAAYMAAWRKSSPYRAIGIYLGGSDAACAQPNLTRGWLQATAAAGWHFIPTYVGPQAEFGELRQPAAQGRQAARDAVMLAKQLGFGPRTPLYYDMEAYLPPEGQEVLPFLSAWTSTLHSLGYLSGVYSSSDSGIADLAANYHNSAYAMPDVIFDAWWNGAANTSDPHFGAGEWANNDRIHQFMGNVVQSYDGVAINIDQDYLDVILPVAPPPPPPAPKPTPTPTASPTPVPSITSTVTPLPSPTPKIPSCASQSS